MPPYTVSRLALIQVAIVFFGVLFTATLVRLACLGHETRQIPFLLNLVDHYGPWLVLIPFAWTITATLSVRELDGAPEVQTKWMTVGFILLFGLAVGLSGTVLAAFGLLSSGSLQGG